jgi:hypothetical protein
VLVIFPIELDGVPSAPVPTAVGNRSEPSGAQISYGASVTD